MKPFAPIRSFFSLLLALSLASCAWPAASQPAARSGANSSPTALASTHSQQASPDYPTVFPQDRVNRIDIHFSAQAWSELQAEMEKQFGKAGAGGPGFGNPGQPPGGQGNLQGRQPPGAGGPGQPPGSGGFNFGDTSFVSSTVSFNGQTWQSVGFRYSGNSTLQSSWRSGSQKISFRLDFDQFEDQDPATRNQRFYGFKKLAFKSNAMDNSYLREKVTADIFRAAGVAASQTAFYAVYIDNGQGAKYYGLYTAVEVVDDTLIKTQFKDGSGNVYKPEGSGAAFVQGTFNKQSFEKQTNQAASDWSDIQAVFAALNAATRQSDPPAWRKGLEAVFDVDGFLRWLAADTIIQNWDTYGAMAHNYYLYTDPGTGRVTWIPWDNNMALSSKFTGPGGGRGGPGKGARALDQAGVGAEWPLIRFLVDDPVYLAKYRQYLNETIRGPFQPAKMETTYRQLHALIAPYVQKEQPGYTQLRSSADFDTALDELIQHAQARYQAVQDYLSAP